MVDIVSRSAWGARSPRSTRTVAWSQRDAVTVHYSFGPTSQTPRQIQDFHVDSNGWADIGYNLLVDAAGNAYEGRGWLTVGAHAAGHNTHAIGICFIGRDGDATPAAKRTIRALYEEASRRAGRRLAMTHHSGLSGQSTSCPGDDLRAWVRAGMPVDGEVPPVTAGGPYEDYRQGVQPGARTLRQYSAGDDVRVVQRAAGTRDDGYYGWATVAAVKGYQAEHGLSVDGVTGSETWGAILGTSEPEPEEPAPAAPQWPGPLLAYPPLRSSHTCRRWQDRMRERGWRIDVDGWYGPQSKNICLQFQMEKRLAVDGQVGPQTWGAAWAAPVT